MPAAADEEQLQKLAKTVFWGESLTFPCAGYQLKANLHIPANADSKGDCPGVVMVHGLSGNKNEAFGLFIKMAGALALNGIAVLRFDGRGHGETGGSTRDVTLLRQIEDVSAACDFLGAQEAIDAKRLGILGLSMGGLVGACVAGQRDDIKALGIWEAPFNLHETMVRLLGPLTVRGVRSTGYIQVGFIELGVKFFEVIEHFDTAAKVTPYRGPVFIAHGTADQIVPMDNAAHWQSTFAQNNPEVLLIPDADHVFTKDAWSWPLINKTASWFKDNI